MNDNSTKHIRVLKSQGELTPRIDAILSHYEQLGVNCKQVIERELIRLKDKLVLMDFLGNEYEKLYPQEDSYNFVKAKITACEEILSVINS